MAKSTHNAASPAGKPRPPRRKRGTALTFTATELDDLARVIGAGQVMLRQTYPIVARLKAAMTRMGVSTKGL